MYDPTLCEKQLWGKGGAELKFSEYRDSGHPPGTTRWVILSLEPFTLLLRVGHCVYDDFGPTFTVEGKDPSSNEKTEALRVPP